MPSAFRHCCFVVGADCFAVAADAVAEVLQDARITRVPHAAPAVLGLVHLRGRIVPVIDMRRRLGFAEADASASRTHLVLRLNDDWYSLLVDEMLDVVEVPEDGIERRSATDVEGPIDAVVGVHADHGRLVHVLDPQRIVSTLSRQREQVIHRQGATHGGA